MSVLKRAADKKNGTTVDDGCLKSNGTEGSQWNFQFLPCRREIALFKFSGSWNVGRLIANGFLYGQPQALAAMVYRSRVNVGVVRGAGPGVLNPTPISAEAALRTHLCVVYSPLNLILVVAPWRASGNLMGGLEEMLPALAGLFEFAIPLGESLFRE